MKTIVTTIAATLLSASISAADIYSGFGEGNTDLTPHRNDAADFISVQPGVGTDIDRYHGLAYGNPDLFQSSGSGQIEYRSAPDSDQVIYVGPGVRF